MITYAVGTKYPTTIPKEGAYIEVINGVIEVVVSLNNIRPEELAAYSGDISSVSVFNPYEDIPLSFLVIDFVDKYAGPIDCAYNARKTYDVSDDCKSRLIDYIIEPSNVLAMHVCDIQIIKHSRVLGLDKTLIYPLKESMIDQLATNLSDIDIDLIGMRAQSEFTTKQMIHNAQYTQRF